jgi:hypothetical protein
LLLIIGIAALARARSSLQSSYIAQAVPDQERRFLGMVALCASTFLAISFAYSLGNVYDMRTTSSFVFSEINVLQYAIAPYVPTLIAIALVLPLIEREGSFRDLQIWSGLLGFSIVAQFPDPGFAYSYLPLAEIIFALALHRLVAKSAPKPLRTSLQERLRTGVPGGSAPQNILLAAKIAGLISVVPVAYFLYTATATLPQNLENPGGAISVAAGVVSQLVGWIIIGVIFSIINTRLPGRSGPVRALIVSALWFAVATADFIVAGWLHYSAGRSWTFFGLELVVFLLAFSAVWDMCILGKLSWASIRHLWEAYNLQRVRSVALYAIPLLLAVITLGQQVLSGSGTQFVQSALSVIPTIFGK